MPVTVKVADGDEHCSVCGNFAEEHCIICGVGLCENCYKELKTCEACTI